MDKEQDNSAYLKQYGAWAGNQKGHQPDFKRCCVEVHDKVSVRFHQCRRNRGHGPGKAYCATHSPDAVKSRKDRKVEKVNEEVAKLMRRAWDTNSAKVMLSALERIAEGHNDPRALAHNVLTEIGPRP